MLQLHSWRYYQLHLRFLSVLQKTVFESKFSLIVFESLWFTFDYYRFQLPLVLLIHYHTSINVNIKTVSMLQCLSLLLLAIVTEIGSTLMVYQKKELFLQSLTLHMKHEMTLTEAGYGLNASDTQLWDEIQLEVSFLHVKLKINKINQDKTRQNFRDRYLKYFCILS